MNLKEIAWFVPNRNAGLLFLPIIEYMNQRITMSGLMVPGNIIITSMKMGLLGVLLILEVT